MQNLVEQIGPQLLRSAPILLVYLGGIAAAVVHRRRHPWAARLALFAVVLMLGGHVVGTAATFWMIHRVNEGMIEDVQALPFVIGMLQSLVHALGIAMLLTAVFIDRPRRDDFERA